MLKQNDYGGKRIAYKGIVHNILNDAPFIGTLIIAKNCSMPCKDCINAHLKSPEHIRVESAFEIMDKVKSNGLDEGIILSGLEWTEQAEDLLVLVDCALENGLKVMVYTHHSEDRFFSIIPELIGKPIYVKFGLYDASLCSETHFSHTVKLATTNQYIKWLAV